MPTITPHLWFDDRAEEAARFYVSVFPDSRLVGEPVRYDAPSAEVGGRPEGSVMTIEFELDGQRFLALNGGPHFRFTEAVSFLIECADQAEIDRYWEALGEGGDPAAQQCGWLKDRFGLSWQVVPAALPELMSDPDPQVAQEVSKALLQMKKLDIDGLRAAKEAARAEAGRG